MYKRAQLGIGYLPQEVSVFRNLSVEDNILAILEMTKMDKKERLDRLEELLEEFSLTHVRKNLGNRLSGGEKRRTEIARSLATNPKFILLDEPFAAMDRPLRQRLREELLQLQTELALPMVLITHDEEDVQAFAQQVIQVDKGRVLSDATPYA